MATAIKAIPTLYGKEAERFLLAAQAAEQRYDAQPHNTNTDTAVLQARQIWANMIH